MKTLIHSDNQNNNPDPADLSLRESTDIDRPIGTKLRMALYQRESAKIYQLIGTKFRMALYQSERFLEQNINNKFQE